MWAWQSTVPGGSARLGFRSRASGGMFNMESPLWGKFTA